jgi:hypothetical protein
MYLAATVVAAGAAAAATDGEGDNLVGRHALET